MVMVKEYIVTLPRKNVYSMFHKLQTCIKPKTLFLLGPIKFYWDGWNLNQNDRIDENIKYLTIFMAVGPPTSCTKLQYERVAFPTYHAPNCDNGCSNCAKLQYLIVGPLNSARVHKSPWIFVQVVTLVSTSHHQFWFKSAEAIT